jgi:hypothetical protein
MPPDKPSYVVLRQTAPGAWELVREVERRPGLPARKARAQAVRDAVGAEPAAGEAYAAVLRSERRIAFEH